MEQQKVTGRMSDHEVRERVLGGERDLFEIFVRRYSPRLYRVTRSILQSPAEVEDIVQDTFLSAYQHLGQFAGRAQFATWLTRIAIHKALRCASSRSREVPIEDSFDAWMQVNGGEFTHGPEHLASSSERAHILAGAVIDPRADGTFAGLESVSRESNEKGGLEGRLFRVTPSYASINCAALRRR